MAQPTDIDETFVREVDENLRRDQLNEFFRKNGAWVIAAVILFLLVSGGMIWWRQHQVQVAQGEVEKLAQVYKDIGGGNVAEAPKQLDELSDSHSKAVRASARFARAALALQQNDTKQAIAIYNQIAADKGLPDPYRDAALVRGTTLQFDQLQPQEVISRLQPLAKPGEPWFGSAGEVTAMAMLKQGKRQDAGQLFLAIARDKTVPDAIRGRAAQLAGSLGVDASAIVLPQAQ